MQRHILRVIILGVVACRFACAQQNPAPFTLDTARQSAVDAPTKTSNASPTVSPVYHDAQGRIVVQGDDHGNYGMLYQGNLSDFSEVVDAYGNRTRLVKPTSAMAEELKHEFIDHSNAWYERFVTDTNGGLLLTSADEGESSLANKAAQFGIQVGYPDWLRVDFARATTINEVDIITLQDNYTQGIRPLRASDAGGPTQFMLYGITDFEVQYLNTSYAWVAVPGGYVTSNRDVARSLVFAPITTSAIRLVVKGGLGSGMSRVVEVEAYEQNTHRNVALSSQGGSATASSVYNVAAYGGSYPPASTIDGDETGKLWASSGGWKDNTPRIDATPGTVQTSDLGGGYGQTKYANQFAQVTKTVNGNPAPTARPLAGQPFMMEKVDLSYTGHTFNAGAYITNKGIEYWDSTGGSRVEYYDQFSKKLFYVSDWCDGYGTRPVVRINRDSQGRPTDVYLGDDLALLQFVYDSQGWLYTRLIDRTTHTAVYGVVRSSGPVTHYPDLTRLTNGFMPEYGQVVEWHDSISPVPNIIATLRGAPYALLPATQNGPVQPARWVIYPFMAEHDPITDIRVEYDASKMYVYIPTLHSGSMVLRQDFTAFVFKRATWLTAENSISSGSQERLYALLDTPPLKDALSKAAVVSTGSPARRSHQTKLRAAKGKNQASHLSTASSRRPAVTLATNGSGTGDGGSGGGEAGADCVVNQEGTAVCGGKPVRYTGTVTSTTSGTGPGDISIDPSVPNPYPGTPPSDPAGGASGPVNPITGCIEPAIDSRLERNPTESQARNGPTKCPTCPDEDPAKYYPPCKLPAPQSLLDRQIRWARANAKRAIHDPKCRAFLLDPVSARPAPGQHTYFESAGYYGNFPDISFWSASYFDYVWDSFQVLDGTGSSFCPDFHPETGCYCGATAFTPGRSGGDFFVCPQVWNWWGTHGGGASMQLALIHEYLHTLGLREQNPGWPPLTYPTSPQIDVALQAACGQAVINAQGSSQPPH